MDFLRTRAIPPLIAAAVAAMPALADDCKALEGRYRFLPAQPSSQPPLPLGNLGEGADRSKLYRREGDKKITGLSPTAPMQRPKMVILAETAVLTRVPRKTRMEFFDAAGKSLATLPIENANKWACRAGRLERVNTVLVGLGDTVRTDRVEEILERNAAGELVWRKVVTAANQVREPVRSEWRYPAVK